MGRGSLLGMVVVLLAVAGAAPAAAQVQAVDVRDNEFVPATVTVPAGGTVVWSQSGANPHTITAVDGSFDSHPSCPPDCMGTGETFTRTFAEGGQVSYYCKIHGSPGQGMAGTIVVEAAAAPAPMPTAAPEQTPPPTSTPGAAASPTPAAEPAPPGAGGAAPSSPSASGELAETGVPLAAGVAALAAGLLVAGGMALRASRQRGRSTTPARGIDRRGAS